MNIIKSFKNLERIEYCIWLGSLALLTVIYFMNGQNGIFALFTSYLGATALIFVSKGDVLGQVLTIVFSFFYAYISFTFKYYGEMITYVGMSAPMALVATITWIKNPYKEQEVKISTLSRMTYILLFIGSCIVTFIFYFILKYFNTNHLYVSTLSVFTSFYAASLVALRSPLYGLAYSCNDLVLIVLWVYASLTNSSYLPMVLNFIIFLVNDLYGFYNWNRLKNRQNVNV